MFWNLPFCMCFSSAVINTHTKFEKNLRTFKKNEFSFAQTNSSWISCFARAHGLPKVNFVGGLESSAPPHLDIGNEEITRELMNIRGSSL